MSSTALTDQSARKWTLACVGNGKCKMECRDYKLETFIHKTSPYTLILPDRKFCVSIVFTGNVHEQTQSFSLLMLASVTPLTPLSLSLSTSPLSYSHVVSSGEGRSPSLYFRPSAFSDGDPGYEGVL